jgi:hypothetical protein
MTLLEQAIVDAEALRDAALKNAETVVLEKYSEQIKEAVAILLEQPLEDPMEDPMGGAAMGAEVDAAPDEATEEMLDDVPLASTQGSNMCPCPEEGEESPLEINVDDLLAQMDAGEEVPMLDRETTATELTGEMPPEEEPMPMEEDLDLDEDLLSSIMEELVVDIEPKKTGWAGTPQSYIELAEEELLALEQDSKVREEKTAIRKAVKTLENIKENLEKKNNILQNKLDKNSEKEKEIIDVAIRLKDRLEESNLTNARLLYTNKVLMNNSLNERQKNRIAESLSKAETVEEAKVIFETLQSASGNALNNKQPKSLSEAVNKTSSTLILSHRKRRAEKSESPVTNRWKVLAGITDKN